MTRRPAALVFWTTAVAYGVLCLVGLMTLPDRVPMHFSGTGEVDHWASRAEAVTTSVVLGAAMTLLFWGLAVAVPRAPRELLNINPRDKAWWLSTPERAARLRSRLADDLYVLGAATLALLLVVEGVTLVQAHQEEPSLGWWFWVAVGVYLVGVLGYCLHLTLRRYRTPRDVALG